MVACKKTESKNKTTARSQKKKELAQILYVQEKRTQSEIAELLGVSQVAVQKWAAQGHWSELRSGVSITKEQQIVNIYHQIAIINEDILSRPEGERKANVKEAKILADLALAVNKMESEVGIAEIVSCGMKFCDFMRSMDVEKAKEVNGYWDSFLRSILV